MSKAIIIAMLEMGRDGLESTARAVPDDKLNWKPLGNGRTVLDLLGEAAQTPALLAKMLNSKGESMPDENDFRRMIEERASWTHDECLQKLHANTEAAIEAIHHTPDEMLEQPVLVPASGATLPMGVWMLMPYRTFAARTAQINYIQTLYGDFESH